MTTTPNPYSDRCMALVDTLRDSDIEPEYVHSLTDKGSVEAWAVRHDPPLYLFSVSDDGDEECFFSSDNNLGRFFSPGGRIDWDAVGDAT